jgi:polyhydroxyalkanoate synthesis regulator phasin
MNEFNGDFEVTDDSLEIAVVDKLKEVCEELGALKYQRDELARERNALRQTVERLERRLAKLEREAKPVLGVVQ